MSNNPNDPWAIQPGRNPYDPWALCSLLEDELRIADHENWLMNRNGFALEHQISQLKSTIWYVAAGTLLVGFVVGYLCPHR